MLVSGCWDDVRQLAGNLMMGALWLREFDGDKEAGNCL